MERSIDAATRFNGGDLGYFTIDVMPEPYGAALKAAKAGQIVGPFQVDAGCALVEGRGPPARDSRSRWRPRGRRSCAS